MPDTRDGSNGSASPSASADTVVEAEAHTDTVAEAHTDTVAGADAHAGEGEGDDLSGSLAQLARGAGIGFLGRIGGKVLAVALEVLLTRTLGPTQYGLYALGNSIRSVGQLFAQLGLRQGAIRFGSIYYQRDDESLGRTFTATLAISIVSGVASAALLYTFADQIARVAFDDPALAPVLELFSFTMPFYILMELTTGYCQAFKRIDAEQFVKNVFRPVANLLFVTGAFALGYRLSGALAGLVVAAALSSLAGGYLLFAVHDARIGVGDLRSVSETARSVLAYSIPMMFVAASYLLATKTDRLMLGMFRGVESVGIYNAAAIVTLQFTIVHSSLLSIFKPIVAAESEHGEIDRVAALYDVVKKWSTYATLALFVVTATFATEILSVFGPEFTRATPVLYVLPLMYVGGSLFGPNGSLLAMAGRQNVEFLNGLLLITLNVALNYLLIPIYGVIGAAIAVVTAGIVTNAIQIVVIYVIFGFHPFDREHVVLTTVTVAVVCVGVAMSATLPLIQRAAGCLALLTICGTLFYRQISIEERRLFTEALAER